MLTNKLYYIDPYIRKHISKVLLCESYENKFKIVLDQTIFYPESGGQPSDTGTIGNAIVSHVFDNGNIIYHIVDKNLQVGEMVECEIDFKKRFRYMQLHSSEHIISGLINRVYHLNNLGFHMNEHTATIDVDGELSKDEIANIENLSNGEVFANNNFICVCPSKEELTTINYRFKKELNGDVRIVYGGSADICACCGTHVKTTGEIGLIKILSSQKHRGGTRIVLTAGNPALELFQQLYRDITEISQMTSSKPTEILFTFNKLIQDIQYEKETSYKLKKELTKLLVENEPVQKSFIFKNIYNFDSNTLREYALRLCSKTPYFVFVISGEENNYKYVLASDKIDISLINKDLKDKLNGKGGGRGDLYQGTLRSTLLEIEAFVSKIGGI